MTINVVQNMLVKPSCLYFRAEKLVKNDPKLPELHSLQ